MASRRKAKAIKIAVKRKRKKRRANDKNHVAWAIAVKARDGMRCRVCGHDKQLNAHHILPYNGYPDIRYDLTNGITLCAGCHAFRKHSAELNGIWFSLWLSKYAPDLLAIAYGRAGEPDFLEYARLRQEKEAENVAERKRENAEKRRMRKEQKDASQ